MKLTPKVEAALPIVLQKYREGRSHMEIASAAGIGKSLVARILANLGKLLVQTI